MEVVVSVVLEVRGRVGWGGGTAVQMNCKNEKTGVPFFTFCQLPRGREGRRRRRKKRKRKENQKGMEMKRYRLVKTLKEDDE